MAFAVAQEAIESRLRPHHQQAGVTAGREAGDADAVGVDQALPARIGEQRTDRRRHLDRAAGHHRRMSVRSEEHTYELQSLMRISYAVFCLKKKKKMTKH